MELIEGRSLREYSKQEKPSIEQILELAIQISDGLYAAHEKKIIHRDIKPSNILIDAYGRPKILDFGLATIQGQEHLTRTGTVQYMSPEQTQGKTVDVRSDLFSFGVVLYEQITGQSPFARDNDMATGQAILCDTPEPLARFRADVSEGLQALIDKALDKDFETRYQTAAGMLSDLKREKKRFESTAAAIPVPPPRRRTMPWTLVSIGAIVVAVVIAVGFNLFQPGTTTEDEDAIKALVVLPFENLGNPDDEYFAAGITDEITAKLASIKALRVTSRTSAIQYKQTDKSLKQIGKELGVDYVLEGTIRWDKSGDTDRVRIIPQLIRVSDDSHIWADTYERAITQIFVVQANIATQIAGALNIALLEPEQLSIEAEPTQNMEAYHLYLRGLELWNARFGAEQAIAVLEKAVELDSAFYQAYALLAQLYGYRHINSMCGTEPCCEQAEEAAERASQFSDGLPEGNIGLGYYHYYCSRDYELALKLFGKALESQPSNVDLMRAIGYVYRRSGRWEESLAMQRQAYQLSPATFSDIHNLATTLINMHKLGEAQRLIDGVLELEPDNYAALAWRVLLIWNTTGDSAQTMEAGKLADQYSPRPFIEYWSEQYDLNMRRFRSAIGKREIPGSYIFADSVEFYMNRGFAYGQLDEPELSHAYYDSAFIVAKQRAESQPEDAFNMADLAEAYAGLGLKEEAIKAAETAAQLLPVSLDVMQGAEIKQSLAEVYTMVGEYDLAIDQLEWLISNPSPLQITGLRMHAEWDPLRDHPRFKALLEKYENQ
jgi:TolB-like protein